MDKNTIIAIVLSTIVIVAGFTVQATFFPPEKSIQTTEIQNAEQPSAVSAVNEVVSEQPSFIQSEETLTETALGAGPVSEERFLLETDLVKVEFSNQGGDIVSFKLKNHQDSDDLVEMADSISQTNRAFSIALGDHSSRPLQDYFNVKKIDDASIGFYRTFAIKNSDGSQSLFTLAKQYTLIPGEYLLDVKITVSGDANFAGLPAGYTLKTSPQIGPEWNAKQDQYEYRRFYHLLNGKKKTVNVSAGQKSKVLTDPVSWAGVAGKYFALIAIPGTTPVSSYQYSAQAESADATVGQISLLRAPITANKSTDNWLFYLGPRTEKNLTPYNLAVNNSLGLADLHLEQIVESSGILGPLEVILKWIMELFYLIIPNWGVSIILLTILMRALIFPLTKKSSEATHKMQELQPKIQEIQTKYKANPQKMNEEMAKFYQTAGYNPLSGCLPMLIQFPLIFAMYGLFNNYFEFRGAMFIPGWIPDLSQGDSLMTLPFTVPFVGWKDLRILPIVYVISQLLFGKVTQTPGSAQQNSSMKFMMYGMPLIFFFIFYNAPSGLLVYWIFSNVLTLIQQVVINKMMEQKRSSSLKLVK
ncbi:membrane protein insertase YidC [Treponema zuelzerae]|uniref:Membrane protein insertase YidC n=1 Tax=Teretinema zuelzerae TaxID=156 RepID=A0AAE3EJ37_9SPIR|nr:membrane protein insertase YidC [Teretinema zuelzerae]MCD1654413.1 membrane protein insertase YidC [Teretinema zuelzerae]